MKKAQLLWPPLTLGLLIAIILFVFIGPDESYELPDYVVGTRAHHIILQETYAQKEYTYTDMIGTYSSWNSLFTLAAQGGHYSFDDSCGVIRDEITLWHRTDTAKDCFPDKQQLTKAYKRLLQDQMNVYAQKRFSGETILNNYRFSLLEQENSTHVVGIALQPYYFIFNKPQRYDELSEAEKYLTGNDDSADRYLFRAAAPTITSHPTRPDGVTQTGIYSVKLDMHTELPYQFNRFMDVVNQARAIVTECAVEDVTACVEQKRSEYSSLDYGWEVQEYAGNIYAFQVTEKILLTHTDQQPVYVFALQLPPSTPQP